VLKRSLHGFPPLIISGYFSLKLTSGFRTRGQRKIKKVLASAIVL